MYRKIKSCQREIIEQENTPHDVSKTKQTKSYSSMIKKHWKISPLKNVHPRHLSSNQLNKQKSFIFQNVFAENHDYANTHSPILDRSTTDVALRPHQPF